jgi:hypothetical protein
MNVKKIDFTVNIEIAGAYLVTESNSEVEARAQLHSNAWDSIQHFNDSLTGYIGNADVEVEMCEDTAWIQKDRGNNP